MPKQENLYYENKHARKDRELRLYYVVTTIIGIAIFSGVLKLNDFSFSIELADAVQTLCDGCFVSGMILFSLWLIAWGWYHGVLDIFLYAAALMLSPFQKEHEERNKEKRDFVTYREQKKLERREPTHLLVVGSIFLGISIILYFVLILL